MSHQKILAILIGVVLAIGVGFNAFFMVDTSQQAVIVQQGKLVSNTLKPGLYAKAPFMQRVVYVEARLQASLLPAVTISTQTGMIDAHVNAVWQITDASKFLAQADADVSSQLAKQAVLAQLSKRLKNRLQEALTTPTAKQLAAANYDQLLTAARKKIDAAYAKQAGIQLVSLDLLGLQLPVGQQAAVYRKMRKEQAGSVKPQRPLGAAGIRADADTQRAELLANAYAKAQAIRGQGDRKAGEIYAKAYRQNPDFYRFYRSMQAYQNVFKGGKNVLVLSTDSEFFQYFTSPPQ